MRWVFYSLLIINLLYFGWQQFARYEQKTDVSSVGQTVSSEVAPIRLFAELEYEDPATNALEKKSLTQRCDIYGPFFAAADSRGFLQTVKGQGISGREERELVQFKPYFWVYVPPVSSKQSAQALVNRLRGYQLNAELISEGRYRNGVALGNVEKRDEIDRLQQRLAGQNIKLEVVEKSRDYEQFWVVLDPGSAARIQGELQDELISKYPDVFHQQKICKPVASGD